MVSISRTFRFGLLPSLGPARIRELVARVAEGLAPVVESPVSLVVAGSYEHLEAMLLGGTIDAAWVNPLLLERLHAAGAPAGLRAVRSGRTTFRSALVTRRESPCELEALRGGRAAWTDPDSLAGYRLPIRFLRSRGLSPERLFSSERFASSYPTALGRVLDGSADVAACFVPDDSPEAVARVLRRLVGSGADGLQAIACTEAVPNDGLVFSPSIQPAVAERIRSALLQGGASGACRPFFDLLDVDEVRPLEPWTNLPFDWAAGR